MSTSEYDTCNLSRSPVFTDSEMETLRKKEQIDGVPLQTQWTFWIDR